MAQTIDNISVPSDSWVDISTVSGITVGVAYTISNEKGSALLLHESSTEPDADEESGRRLTVFPETDHIATIPSGSLKIWAKSLGNKGLNGSEINVQEG